MEQQDKEQQKVQSKEEKDTQEFAKRKNIPTHNVLKVKESSNLYKDHPELEPNLYFYRDQNGTVRAEYIDENGKVNYRKMEADLNYYKGFYEGVKEMTTLLGDGAIEINHNINT